MLKKKQGVTMSKIKNQEIFDESAGHSNHVQQLLNEVLIKTESLDEDDISDTNYSVFLNEVKCDVGTEAQDGDSEVSFHTFTHDNGRVKWNVIPQENVQFDQLQVKDRKKALIYKKRASRCTVEQYTVMIDFIASNQIMMQGKATPDVDKLWQELTLILNSKKGARKTVYQWKRTFIEYKSKVKGRAKELQRTGGGGDIKELNDTEQKLAALIDLTSTENDSQLSAVSLNNPSVNDNRAMDIEEISNGLPVTENKVEITDTDGNTEEVPVRIYRIKPDLPSKKDSAPTVNIDKVNDTNNIVAEKSPTRIRRLNRHKRKRNSAPNRISMESKLILEHSKQMCKVVETLSLSLREVARANNNIAKSNNNIAKALLRLKRR